MRNLKSILAITFAALSLSAVAQTNSSTVYSSTVYMAQPLDFGNADDMRALIASAEAGKADTQLGLAHCFYAGQGVATNYVAAYKWATLASTGQPNIATNAATLVQTLEARMTPQQIAEAQAAAKAFRPKPPAASP